jgi:hypothetical protein
MFGRRPQAPPSAAQLLSMHLRQAAVEYEREKEELEAILISLRGMAAYASDCESRALQRGSPAALAFRMIGQATQALGAGADRAVAALPPPNPAALQAYSELLGLGKPTVIFNEDEEEVPAAR